MKVPISWLKTYVDFEDSVQGLADRLTFSGIEVEGIETIGSSFEGIVVGEVISVERHPNADRLTVCRVHDGNEEVQVVCGAPNVRAGAKIPFAPLGACLPDGTKMKRAKIRQVESFGMLLAADELGLSDDHAGVIILDDHWKAGTPLSDVMGPPETVLDLEITPNRPDSLCMLGVAREVAALYGTKLKRPDVNFSEADPSATEQTQVAVQDDQGCPRYVARILTGIQIGPSPDWMQRCLTHAGVRPINNVVDITNYVMLEMGHPLHAFDQSFLSEGRIVVRRAQAGEKMHTLDDVERTLDADMLVIADAQQPVAIAGIMGGAGSEISEATTTVLLEAEAFDAQMIRTTSRRLGLSTESSYRFERGVDPASVDWASRRAAALMAECAGATVATGAVDVYPRPVVEHALVCRWQYVRDVTGMDVSNEAIQSIFESIELSVTDSSASGVTVRIPTFRRDLEREVDLVEEVARLHGLDHVPTPSPRAELVPHADFHASRAQSALTTRLVGLGFREIMNYSLTSPGLLDLFDAATGAERIVMPNPISADQSVLRTSLIPQLVETLGRNHSRQIAEAQLFECGRAYRRGGDGALTEDDRISLGVMGPVGRSPFGKRKALAAREVFLWLKGMVAALASAQRISDYHVEPIDHPFLEPGQAARVLLDGQEAGIMGIVRASIRKEWRLSDPVAVAELSIPALLRHYNEPIAAQAVPVFPAIVRDMALIVGQTVRHEDVLAIVQKAAPRELEKIELFDIFEGDAIGADKKSLAYSVTYRDPSRTLTDDDANAYHEKVKAAIKRDLDAVTIREG